MFPAGTTFELAEYSLQKKGWDSLISSAPGTKNQFTDLAEAIAGLQADFDHKALTFQFLEPQIYIAGTDFKLPEGEGATLLNLTTLLVCSPGTEKRPITKEELGMVRLEQSTFQVAVLTRQLAWVPCNEIFDLNAEPISIAAMAAAINNASFTGQLLPSTTSKGLGKIGANPSLLTILVHDQSAGSAPTPITLQQLAALRVHSNVA